MQLGRRAKITKFSLENTLKPHRKGIQVSIGKSSLSNRSPFENKFEAGNSTACASSQNPQSISRINYNNLQSKTPLKPRQKSIPHERRPAASNFIIYDMDRQQWQQNKQNYLKANKEATTGYLLKQKVRGNHENTSSSGNQAKLKTFSCESNQQKILIQKSGRDQIDNIDLLINGSRVYSLESMEQRRKRVELMEERVNRLIQQSQAFIS